MPTTRSNGLRGTRRVTRRRRTRRASATSKVRYQRPTATNQRKQIARNTKLLAQIAYRQYTSRIWTDWQYSFSVPMTDSVWGVVELTSFDTWQPVLRQSQIVQRKAHTYIQRMQLNMRWTLHDANFCGMSIFVVSMRKYAGNTDPLNVPLTLGQDWIEPANSQGFNVRLNSAIFKVHWSRYITMTSNAFTQPEIAGATAGDPDTTWGKGQANIKMNLSVSNPVARTGVADTWLEIPFENLPYYGKYYLMMLPSFQMGTGTVLPFLGFDALYTCINSS